EPLLGKTHSVRLSLDEQLGHVSIDRHQLGQVLTNLVANARDAMRGGTIEIAGRHSDHDHGTVCFTVSDRGTGIVEEMRERIFEPLFTTKSTGTGLGLAIVQQIVLHHRGRITVESEEGVGTTFTVTLAQA
ncbi:MAG: two-component system, NtrC family, sensor kinase, partial [Acidobacteriota bacterium]|nr:two-component system, NtrC family, sensor kinase [Acidobacteriota bacterium]